MKLVAVAQSFPISKMEPNHQQLFEFTTPFSAEDVSRVFPMPADAFVKDSAIGVTSVSYHLLEAPPWLVIYEEFLVASLSADVQPGSYSFSVLESNSSETLSMRMLVTPPATAMYSTLPTKHRESRNLIATSI